MAEIMNNARFRTVHFCFSSCLHVESCLAIEADEYYSTSVREVDPADHLQDIQQGGGYCQRERPLERETMEDKEIMELQ